MNIPATGDILVKLEGVYFAKLLTIPVLTHSPKISLYNRLIVILLLLFTCSVIGQVDTLKVRYLGQEQGLMQLNVRAIEQDNSGYLWVGTEDGLHRFDGYGFEQIQLQSPDKKRLRDNYITDLLHINDTLWMGSLSRPVSGYILSEDRYFETASKELYAGLKTNQKVLKVGEGHLLFSYYTAFLLFDRETKQLERFKLPPSKEDYAVTSVAKMGDGTFLLGTTRAGLIRFDPTAKKMLPFLSFPAIEVNALHTQGDNVYIGADKGLYVFNMLSRKLKKVNFKESVTAFKKINNTSFYVGTQNGLRIYTEGTGIQKLIFKDENAGNIYNPVEILDIHSDAKGNLWVGTEGEGMFYYNAFTKKFTTDKIELAEYPAKVRISSFQFIKEGDETLWIACTFGVVKYNLRTKKSKLYNDRGEVGSVYALRKDAQGRLWAGGFGHGLLLYDREKDAFKRYLNIESDPKSLPENDVMEIISIDENTLWVCTLSAGILEMNIKEETFTSLLLSGEKITRNRTHFRDSKGRFWLGGDQGLYQVLNNKIIAHYVDGEEDEGGLSGKRIFAIVEDPDQSLWIATNNGFTHLDPENRNVKHYTTKEGLPNNFVYAILQDANENIWVSTNIGISMLNKQTDTFVNYTDKDGLQNNEFNGKCAYKDEAGTLYFGGVDGFNIFNPDALVENPFLPKVMIDQIELFNNPLDKKRMLKDTLRFKSDENVLSFGFTALNFINPEKASYQYKMEGFDPEWRPVTKERTTTYTNLDPGTYTLNVKASNDVGKWNPKLAKKTITIVPPWYQQTLFRLSLLTFIIVGSVLFYFYKTYQFNQDRIRLEGLVAERTTEVQSKNEALEDAVGTLEKQRDNIAFLMKELRHRVKNNLQVISSLLNIQSNTLTDEDAQAALQVAKNRILTIAHIQEQLTTEEETIDLSLFLKDVSKSIIQALNTGTPKFQVSYELSANVKILGDASTLVGLILNELITNTSKYAFTRFRESNTLTITSQLENEFLVLQITDNGKGYTKEEMRANSLGLDLVGEMARQLKSKIQTTSDNGVTNTITIPLSSITPKIN